jgi:diadenosine tetraphosphate (Ap4A) HIT family hydrolase
VSRTAKAPGASRATHASTVSPAKGHTPNDVEVAQATPRHDGIVRRVPETPEQLWKRVAVALRMPPVHEWETFPFDGELRPRTLAPPVPQEQPRQGEGGVDCYRCGADDDEYLWTSERWRVRGLGPAGLPVIVMLEPREHYAEPGDLPDDVAAEQGVLLARIERAVRAVGDIGRVHVCRWGDGSEHLHWWLMARPARIPQLIGSFAAIWDDILPPTPEEIWRDNLAIVARELA